MLDVKINGKGNITGGEYHSVTINGAAECEGLLNPGVLKINGSFQCPGVLDAEEVRINGNFNCDGDLKTALLRVDGRLKCGGSLTAGAVTCDGTTDVQGNVSVRKLNVNGSFRVLGGDRLEAESINCNGLIKFDGQICADELMADGLISVREIVGDRITINSRIPSFVRIFIDLASKADLIEATTIRLRGVTAKTVNGHDVDIGPGCTIENLDCSGTLTIDPCAVVRTVTGNYNRAAQ